MFADGALNLKLLKLAMYCIYIEFLEHYVYILYGECTKKAILIIAYYFIK